MTRQQTLIRPAEAKRLLSAFVVVMVFAASGATAVAGVPSGAKLIKRVQKAYRDFDTFSCHFRQEFQWALAGEVEVTEGTMELAKGDRFRFETPFQIMATDGVTLWRYSLTNHQVIIENIKDAEPGLLPREILFEYPDKFKVEQVKEAVIAGEPAYLLELKPRDKNTGLSLVKVWIGREDSITRRMEWFDEAGNRTTYILSDIVLNQPIPPERFILNVPEGTTIYDLR